MYVGWGDITKLQLESDLLVMGGSRAWVQYDPAILDSILETNSYILGFDGSHLNRQIVKYKIYNHYQKIKPNVIIINIDFFALDWRDGYEREQFFPFMWNPCILKEIRTIEPFSFGENYIPMYRYLTHAGILIHLQETLIDDGLYKGFCGVDRTWNPTEYNNISEIHFNKNENTYRMFESFLNERTEGGIRIIFCYAPMYYGVTKKINNIQEMYDTYQEIAEKYNIPILDYTHDNISYDTLYFYNGTHLNKKGAELFTEKLAHDLDSMGCNFRYK